MVRCVTLLVAFLAAYPMNAHGVDVAPASGPLVGALASTLDSRLLGQWRAKMVRFGKQHCLTLQNKSAERNVRRWATFYDAQRVYFQIYDETGDSFWKKCAAAAERAYRDEFVFPNRGKLQAYWNFTAGLRMDYERTGDSRSKEAVILLSENAAFARDSTPPKSTWGADRSREVAYTILSYLDAEQLGAPRRARLSLLVKQALGHIDQWFVAESAKPIVPFMVGLTLEALIRYHTVTPDDRIPRAVELATDELWKRAWLPKANAFYYSSRQRKPAPDLNMLIAPAYGWLYSTKRRSKYRDRGDALLEGAMGGAFLNRAKQFNQTYRGSFDYIRYRR